MIGGFLKGDEPFKSVSVYDVEHDYWKFSAGLRIERHSAAGCAIKDTIYVVGGIGEEFRTLNSIERLQTGVNGEVSW